MLARARGVGSASPEVGPSSYSGGVMIDAVAYHEAGHAVIAWRHGTHIRERGISIDDGRGWYTSAACATHSRAILPS